VLLDLNGKTASAALEKIEITIKELKFEEVLEVVCDSPDFLVELQNWCEVTFNEFRGVDEDEDDVLHYYLARPMIIS
jgi:TusA-related sulfurtransferase